jgi:hypothetical protein
MDVTKQMQKAFGRDIRAALKALATLEKHFGRETVSAAIGEVSEVLVERFANAKRIRRGGKGHDLIDKFGRKIEVKARLPGTYADSRQFNFRRHSSDAYEVFCFAWDTEPRLSISHVFRISGRVLKRRWGRTTGAYVVRVNLRQLKAAFGREGVRRKT